MSTICSISYHSIPGLSLLLHEIFLKRRGIGSISKEKSGDGRLMLLSLLLCCHQRGGGGAQTTAALFGHGCSSSEHTFLKLKEELLAHSFKVAPIEELLLLLLPLQ